ncbi:LCP family protein [Salibacterium halotolerans]|uniref:Cell envelope-related function transcriptional attenuator common domain-containing protein n=1 Tax=Salibacterium halotolerans TaxID=1884432 RepID=A0A1I5SWM4_9BACI|nr:LCP family protein [Salibacterium halotolerans]SFP75185.1 cell envelope-related function transcriptional attenuator common domain-containing protein [Salibacterium halotolerans]
MWKPALIIFITVLLTMLTAGAGWSYYLYQKAGDHVQEMNDNYEKDVGTSIQSSGPLRGTVSFLILGIGDRPGKKGLADTVMAASINPNEESVLLFNIPRDTKVNIPGHGRDKINHAYAYGGAGLVKQTAENKLDHSFDFVVEADMQGFSEIVDQLGGVEVENDFAFSQDNVDHSKTFHFKKGKVDLNGKEALEYVRMRKSDPRGDLGRNERQRDVLTALLKDTMSLRHLPDSADILEILENHVKTNITLEELRALFTRYRSSFDYIQTFELAGSSEREGGVSYYNVTPREWEKAALRLNRHH